MCWIAEESIHPQRKSKPPRGHLRLPMWRSGGPFWVLLTIMDVLATAEHSSNATVQVAERPGDLTLETTGTGCLQQMQRPVNEWSGFSRLWLKTTHYLDMWCICVRYWSHHTAHYAKRRWISHCVCIQDVIPSREEILTDWKWILGTNLWSKKDPSVSVGETV